MIKSFFRMLCMLCLLPMLVGGTEALAASVPEIIEATAVRTGNKAHLRVKWKSAKPVVQVRVLASGESAPKEFKASPHSDNRRNGRYYYGDYSFVVDLAGYANDVETLTVEAKDVNRRMSRIVAVKIPAQSSGGLEDDDRLSEHLSAWKDSSVEKAQDVDKRYKVPPLIADFDIQHFEDGNVAFEFKVGGEDLSKVVVRILNAKGQEVGRDEMQAGGIGFAGTSKTFTLSPGGFVAKAVAYSTSGQTSPERQKSFTIQPKVASGNSSGSGDTPADPTDPVDPDPIDPVDPVDPIDPGDDPVDPGEPVEPIDPIDPIDPVDPVDPIDPGDDPVDPGEPVEPIDPIDPIDPVDPVDPIDPGDDPVDPGEPVEPIDPIEDPEEPVDTAKPSVAFGADLYGNVLKYRITVSDETKLASVKAHLLNSTGKSAMKELPIRNGKVSYSTDHVISRWPAEKYTLSVEAVDAAGNTNAATRVVDWGGDTKPRVTLEASIRGEELIPDFTVKDDYGLKSAAITVSKGGKIASRDLKISNGKISNNFYDTPLAKYSKGTLTIRMDVEDVAGNKASDSTSVYWKGIVDNPPTASVKLQMGDHSVKRMISMSDDRGLAKATLYVTAFGKTAECDVPVSGTSKSNTKDIELDTFRKGTIKLKLVVRDTAGQEKVAADSAYWRGATDDPPACDITLRRSGDKIYTTLKANDDYGLTRGELVLRKRSSMSGKKEPISLAGKKDFSKQLRALDLRELAKGSYSFDFTVYDTKGQKFSDTRGFEWEGHDEAPTAKVRSTLRGDMVQVELTASDDKAVKSATLKLQRNGKGNTTNVRVSNGRVSYKESYSMAKLPKGKYVFKFTVTDSAGQKTEANSFVNWLGR